LSRSPSPLKGRIKPALIVSVLPLLALTGGCDSQHPPELLGGQTSIYNVTPNAFSQPAPGLEREQELLFFVGNSFFNQNWVTAPSSTEARDGLGPLFNARSCAGCHFKDGRGRPPESDGESGTGLLVRLSLPNRTEDGSYFADPIYGGQIQDYAIQGILPEARVTILGEEIRGEYTDGTTFTLRQPVYRIEELGYGELHPDIMLSPRVAPQMIGMGLLEAIPEEKILANADPSDRDGDGISGRPNRVWDRSRNSFALGRFGWKANQPTVLQQTAGAFLGDIGITTSVFPEQNCAETHVECLEAQRGGNPEIDDDDLMKVVLYASSLAVPAMRNPDDPQVIKGGEIFEDIGCGDCHTPSTLTGIHPTIPALSEQTIHPYTDLLLHDMGEALADRRPDFEATGREWRTPPLWGIGLFETVNGHTYYLHDGRARNLSEAILWHGGEAAAVRTRFLKLPLAQRQALVQFLQSL